MAMVNWDQLRDDYAAGEYVSVFEYVSAIHCAEMQSAGGLEAVGEGVIWGLAVSDGGGLTVNIAAGSAVVESEKCFTFLTTDGLAGLAVPPNATVYIRAYPLIPAAPGDPDSRETGVMEFGWTLGGGAVAGTLILAQVVTGPAAIVSVTDQRSYTRAVDALRRIADVEGDIAAIQLAIGWPYGAASDIATRLTALESGAGGGGADAPQVYWRNLEAELGDSETIDQQIDEDVAAHVAALHAGDAGAEDPEALVESWDWDALCNMKGVLKNVRTVDPQHALTMPNQVVVVWNVYGDGTGDDVDFVDRVNSTWLGST